MQGTSMTDRDSELEQISRKSLDCIRSVASQADQALQDRRAAGAGTLTTINTFTDGQAIDAINAITDTMRGALADLAREPIIARVTYEDEDGHRSEIFITRGSPPPNIKGVRLASYRSPVGRIAALRPGDEAELRTSGEEQYVVVHATAKLHPIRENDNSWDSKDNQIEIAKHGAVTISSLREFLSPGEEVDDEDLLAALLEGEEAPTLVEGIRRGVISHMALRDQPILDKHQDEIFRLPINSRCFLSGPPGTGKTTTLIRRIGQKLDLTEIDDRERSSVRAIEGEGSLPHRESWLMFSPTELLRQYVKEAFAREGIAASDEHIKTWTAHRRELARNVLGLLRTGTGRGAFVERPNDTYLAARCGTSDAARWFEEFRQFVNEKLLGELQKDAEGLSQSKAPDLSKLGVKIARILDRLEGQFHGRVAPELAALVDETQKLAQVRKAELDKITTLNVNRLLREDRAFLDALAAELSRQKADQESDVDEDDEDDEVDFDDDAAEQDETVSSRISRKQALRRYEQAIRAQARAVARKRKVRANSPNGLLLDWLGQSRLPSQDELTQFARLTAERSRLQKFANIERLIINRIPRLYKAYRRDNADGSDWYVASPSRPNDVCWMEVDLLILAMLKTASEMLSAYAKGSGTTASPSGFLDAIRSAYRNQILVDEASDFSVIQLACMHELAHPSLRSFFACGDFNQRLTTWGITNSDDLAWVAPDIDRRSITISYRQSGRLVELAKKVAELGGSQANEIVLPDRLDIEGYAPVWAKHMSDDSDTAKWLSERIREIETIVQTTPSIAVLVNEEARVEPLATALDTELQDMNLSAAACKDGKVVGNDRDIRVFDIQHIKGMEFEAVFFIDLDRTIASKKELFAKYLYVGATRAATFLGITFHDDVPTEVASLAPLFANRWVD
jgi:DNA polymerase III delta prime subunit